jgi:hypothetical protein
MRLTAAKKVSNVFFFLQRFNDPLNCGEALRTAFNKRRSNKEPHVRNIFSVIIDIDIKENCH